MKKIKRYFAGIIVFALAVCLCAVTTKEVRAEGTHTVSYNLTGVNSSTSVAQVEEGSSLTMTLTPKAGYSLPEEVTVTMAGNELSDGYTYENGVLKINEVYGDTVITVTGVSTSGNNSSNTGDSSDNSGTDSSESYSITYDLYKVTASKQDGKVAAGTTYSVKLKADSGYKLNGADIAVSVNGEYITSGYIYNEGVLTISSISGDTIIEAIASEKSSSQKSTSEKVTNGKNTKNNSNSSSAGSKSAGNSKSAQALANSGKNARNYTSGSYRAPKTGQVMDIRYFGIASLILIGGGIVIIERKKKLQ